MEIIDKIRFLYSVRRLPHDKPQVYVIDELAVAYVQIPKVASRSVRTAISRHLAGDLQPEESDASLVGRFENLYSSHMDHKQIAQLAENYFVFAIVRNPYTRILSCYKNKVLQSREPGRKSVFQRYGLDVNASLEEFVDFISKVPDRYADRHFRSQAWFLTWQGNLLPSYVAKLENIDQDWQEIHRRSGIQAPPRMNVSENHKKIVLSPDLKKIIYQRYTQDFVLFGYDS